jgi:hypothetical protein
MSYVLFGAEEPGTNIYGIWRTDGTPQGTFEVDRVASIPNANTTSPGLFATISSMAVLGAQAAIDRNGRESLTQFAEHGEALDGLMTAGCFKHHRLTLELLQDAVRRLANQRVIVDNKNFQLSRSFIAHR